MMARTLIEDDALPGLAAAADLERLGARLGTALGGGPVRVEAMEILKHKPGRRCALAIRLGDGRIFFAKAFATDRGASIAVTMVADSPGVFSRIDVVEPPNIAP